MFNCIDCNLFTFLWLHMVWMTQTCRTYASGSRIQPTRRRHSSLNDFSPQQGQSRGPPPEYFRRHNSANALIPEPQTSQMAAVGYLSSFRRTPTDPMAAAFQQTKFWSWHSSLANANLRRLNFWVLVLFFGQKHCILPLLTPIWQCRIAVVSWWLNV